MLTLSNKASEFLTALYEKEYEKLYHFALLRLKDHHRSEEIVQDTFLAAHIKGDLFKTHENPAGWLMDTLKNKLKHELRAKQRVTNLLIKMSGQAENVTYMPSFEGNDIEAKLAEDERRLLHIVYIEGYSTKEAAKSLGMSYPACRKKLQRLRERLKDENNQYVFSIF